MHEMPLIYVIFTAVTAVGVLLQAIVLLAMLLALKGALGRLDQVSKLAEEHVIPTMAATRKLLEEIGPQLKTAVLNAVETTRQVAAVTKTVREKTDQASVTLDDLLKRAETQAERVDEMVTGTLDSLAQATAVLQRMTSGPSRRISAILNGLRAGFDVLVGREREVQAAADGDHFV